MALQLSRHSILALGLLIGTATPAPAQQTGGTQPSAHQVDVALAAAARARAEGNCIAHGNAITEAENALRAWADTIGDLWAPRRDVRNYMQQTRYAGLLRSRIEEERAQPCGSTPPNDATMADLPAAGPLGPALPPEPPARAPVISVQIDLGYGVSTLPLVNYAFMRDGPAPAPDVPAAYSVRRPDVIAVEASLETRNLGTFSLGYAQGDASNHTEIAASTTGGARGYPYSAISPSGSTGLGGNVPMEVDTEEQVDEYRMNWSMRFGAEPPAEVLEALRTRLNATVGVTATYRQRDHLGITSITTPVIATQRLEQDVKELEIGVSAGLEAVVPLSAGARLRLGAQAGAYYFDYDLRSVERNTQNFGPLADRDFTTRLQDSVGDIGYHGDAITELSIDLGARLELFARGRASYDSDRAQILNPFSGTAVQNGETTRLGTDHAFDWSISIGLRIELSQGSGRFR